MEQILPAMILWVLRVDMVLVLAKLIAAKIAVLTRVDFFPHMLFGLKNVLPNVLLAAALIAAVWAAVGLETRVYSAVPLHMATVQGSVVAMETLERALLHVLSLVLSQLTYAGTGIATDIAQELPGVAVY